MANRSGGRSRQVRITPARQPGTPVFQEPEVRRWPHPVSGSEPLPSPGRQAAASGQADPALYYIHGALSYQNQLLADIKVLLEQLAADGISAEREK